MPEALNGIRTSMVQVTEWILFFCCQLGIMASGLISSDKVGPPKLVVSRGPYLRFLGVTSYNPSHFSIYLYEAIYRVSRNHPIYKPSTPSMPGFPALFFEAYLLIPFSGLKVAGSRASGLQHRCKYATWVVFYGNPTCSRWRCLWTPALTSGNFFTEESSIRFFLRRFGTYAIRVFVRISPSWTVRAARSTSGSAQILDGRVWLDSGLW